MSYLQRGAHSLTISHASHALPLSAVAALLPPLPEAAALKVSVAPVTQRRQSEIAASDAFIVEQQRGVLTVGTVLASAASPPVADSPAEIPRFVLPGSRSQLAEDSSSSDLQVPAGVKRFMRLSGYVWRDSPRQIPPVQL